MNNEWKNYLLSINANIENNQVKDFAKSLEEETSSFDRLALADLSHYSLIQASGDDVVPFLQGQLTNDIKLVSENTSQLSAYCNPKGRILANFRIFKRDGKYYLRLRNDTIEATLKRLRMYVMRSKVELADISDDLVGMGVAGERAQEKLTAIFSTLPTEADGSISESGITLIKLPGTLPQYEAYGSADEIIKLWNNLANDAVFIGENSWNLLTIRAGIPEIVAKTVEEFVPQMVNLQAINSLSFTKGCYPGQEIVARMHYLGKLKRRLYRASVECDVLPEPGQAIMTADENPQKVGQVVNASWASPNIAEILTVLKIENAEANRLHLDSDTHQHIQLAELPYSLDKDKK